ncbi:MAG: T9SS type A sorting domain-containing protein [Labilibaculum sp.]|nr:T9SS type A sorting domain-containing protein [Labilibaculum sp.]
MLQVRYIFTLLFILLSISGQGQIKIGDWREHLPYQKAKSMLVGGDNLYCLTESGLFSYSLNDNEIVAYSKTKGLAESEITAIAWAESSQSLLIGYANGNLDVVSEGGIQNISDIKNFTLVENKTINTITSTEDLAYLGTDFGIVVINMDKMEVADTYFIGAEGEKLVVNDIEINSSSIWAASDLGIFKADLSSGNLADFNNWEHQQNIPDFQRKCGHLEIIDGDVLVSRFLSETTSELYRNRDGVWSKFSGSYSRIYTLRNIDNQLWVVQAGKTQIFNANGIENSVLQYSEITEMRDALKVAGRTFIADYQASLLEIDGSGTSQIKPDGPLSLDISNVFSIGNKTWAVAGGVTSSYEGLGAKAELYLFEDQKWTNYSNENAPFFNNKSDLVSLTGNKRDQSLVYTASWGYGIFVFESDEYQANWNSENSPLGSKGISGMDADEDGNLWILDANSSAPVKILSFTEEWTSLNYSTLANRVDMQKIVCLKNGDKWVLNAPGQALFAFNENETLTNQDDDVVASFLVRDENNSTISSKVYDLVEDDNGDIWLGTSSGVAVYSNPGNIFRNGNFFAYQPIISIDGSTQFLLGTESVNTIALNGANQKWLGTANSGVFLISENGDEQLTHFTSENSPLPSNTIHKISVNSETGEVFFVTDKGMVSYKGEVTAGTESYNDLYVYPNPVRETYHGDVVVSGLMAESTVKITDISGNLVIEGKSGGGQFVWDGKNFNGSRVHTGVYLIFCSNSDGSKSKVIKLLFIH